jgi:hypothetical protein
MTAPHMIDPARMLGQALSDASPDLMRHLLGTVINSLLSADADAVCGAEGELRDRSLALAGHSHDVLTELFRECLGHGLILPARTNPHRSEVN